MTKYLNLESDYTPAQAIMYINNLSLENMSVRKIYACYTRLSRWVLVSQTIHGKEAAPTRT